MGPGRKYLFAAIMALFIVQVVAARHADATPAYGRRYDLACSTCHAPLPPRLNNFGIVFRKLGFRLPDADDQGNLVLKTVSARSIADGTAVMANVDARRDKETDEGNRATFELGEVEVVAGTAIGNHVAAQAMFVPWDEGEAKLENAEVQFNAGTARHQFIARGGLLQTYVWHKGNHGTLTLSMPLVFDEMAPAAPQGFVPFGLGMEQIGGEVGYMFTSLNEGKLSSTMVTVSLLNGVDSSGERALRNTTGGVDVYVQAQQLFGSRNTVGAFYYHGRTALGAAPSGDGMGSAEEGVTLGGKQQITRYGLRGNYLLFKRLDVVAGGAFGSDRLEPDGMEVKSRGLFAEATLDLAKRWIAVYRYDVVDPDKDTSGDLVRAHTFSTTFQAEDHLYLTGEYQWKRIADASNNAFIVNARLIY